MVVIWQNTKKSSMDVNTFKWYTCFWSPHTIPSRRTTWLSWVASINKYSTNYYLSCSRGRDRQGPPPLPQPALPEGFSRPRVAADHPGQPLPPHHPLWVNSFPGYSASLTLLSVTHFSHGWVTPKAKCAIGTEPCTLGVTKVAELRKLYLTSGRKLL